MLAQQVMFTKWNLGRAARAAASRCSTWTRGTATWPRASGCSTSWWRARPANPIILSGDIHSSWAANILENFDHPAAGIVAAEFVGTSITSDFPAAPRPRRSRSTLPDNPHIRYFEGLHHGYVRCEVTPALWRSDYRGVDSILTPSSPVTTLASFVVQAGLSGISPRSTREVSGRAASRN